MSSITCSKPTTLALLLVLFLLSMYYALKSRQKPFLETSQSSERYFRYQVWPDFNPNHEHDHDWYKANCFPSSSGEGLGIAVLQTVVNEWSRAAKKDCIKAYQQFTEVYTVTQRNGELVLPDDFKPRVLGWLGGNEQLMKQMYKQSVTSVFNEYTQENTLYNPLRGKRPIPLKERPDRIYVEELHRKTIGSCDFCNYEKYSAYDTFGRLTNERAFTAANTFKVDGYHALALYKTHHPLNWTWADFKDMHSLMDKWYDTVFNLKPSYQYPCLFWDMLPHAGASQPHPHVHVTLIPDRYYGPAERFRRAAERYYRSTNRNYFSDLVQLHGMIGLGVQHGTAHALAYLTGKKDTEIVLLGKALDDDFLRLYYCVIRMYLDDMEIVDYSLAGYLPQMTKTRPVRGAMPVFIQVVSRGDAAMVRSDVSALELFAVRNVNLDPWKMMEYLKKSLSKRIPMLKSSN